MSVGRRVRLGELAVSLGFVSPQQVGAAVVAQGELAQRGRPEKLGRVLISQGALADTQLAYLLSCQASATHQCPECRETLRTWRRRMIDHLAQRGEPFVVKGDLGIRPKPTLHSPHYPKQTG